MADPLERRGDDYIISASRSGPLEIAGKIADRGGETGEVAEVIY